MQGDTIAMMYTIELTEYRAGTSPPQTFPKLDTLTETHGSTRFFSYTDGVLVAINDPEEIRRRKVGHPKCAGVLITEGQQLPGEAEARVYFTIHGHPKEPSGDNVGSADIWFPLGFEEEDTSCLFNYFGESNNLPCNPHTAEPTPSWAKLFIGTTHIPRTTGGTPRVLSGPPEILWGLLALNVGHDIDNLGAYVKSEGPRLSLNWKTDRNPDRTPARVSAVRIYPNTGAPQNGLDIPITLV